MEDFAWSTSWTHEGGGLDQFGQWGSGCLPSMANYVGDFYRGGEGENGVHAGGNNDGGGDEGSNGVDDGGGNGGGGKVESASRNHSEAEKRRRDRINAHLAILRKLVSTSDKMDKATLLGKVVEHLKDLKSETKELSKVLRLPTDSDELTIDLVSNTPEPSNCVFIKTTICCEDRPELLLEINRALKGLRLAMVEANITCLGGRIKCEFVLCVANNTSASEVTTLKQALRMSFGRIVSSSSWTTSSSYRIKSKRQRFFCSSNYNTKGSV